VPSAAAWCALAAAAPPESILARSLRVRSGVLLRQQTQRRRGGTAHKNLGPGGQRKTMRRGVKCVSMATKTKINRRTPIRAGTGPGGHNLNRDTLNLKARDIGTARSKALLFCGQAAHG
jgi:hypothetical protein